MHRAIRAWRSRSVAGAAVLSCIGLLAGYQASTGGPAGSTGRLASGRGSASCPWVAESRDNRASPLALAGQVVARMSLRDKAEFVVLHQRGGTENINVGVPSLCIPPLTLSDGPNGIAYNVAGVTQLPAAIGVAASFNPEIARATGQVLGAEARTKGIDVAQGPELNLARVPQSGRIFETFGEDPYLTSVMGVANIGGIQSQGVMANAKHFSAYTQETARIRLDQIVPVRALAELYDAPFRAAVTDGHVASVMCSYGSLNGVNACSDPYVYSTLHTWGFSGFVRSDLGAVSSIVPAFRGGLSLVKPGSSHKLIRSVHSGVLHVKDLDRAVTSVLAQMFAYGMIAHPRTGSITAAAQTPAHRSVALTAAEASAVLLKNSGSILPLPATVASVAVIGTAASTIPRSSGGGSSAVRAPFVVTPLAALRSALGKQAQVTYRPGGPTSFDQGQLGDSDITSGTPLPPETPITVAGEPGKSDLTVDSASNVTAAVATASHPGTGEGWNDIRFVVRPRATGTYEVSAQEVGDTWLSVDGHPLLASSGLHARTSWSTTISLVAGHRYTFTADWFSLAHQKPPQFGIANVTPYIDAAVAAARKAEIAVVFAGDFTTEGADRSSLNLPGEANALIAAVAAANPRTVVVLNTGGAVLMPWLDRVAGVIEAWYPGQANGAAIAAILTGSVSPSGRLPITFPATAAQPVSSSSQFPGVNSVVDFGSGLDVGYRWYQTHGATPLFPFGFGLDYTSFRLSSPTLVRTPSGLVARLTVSNTGARPGVDVVQAYVRYPSSSGEPPEQLRAFARVDVGPSSSITVSIPIPQTAFQRYVDGVLATVPGTYWVDIGQSSADLPIHLSVGVP